MNINTSNTDNTCSPSPSPPTLFTEDFSSSTSSSCSRSSSHPTTSSTQGDRIPSDRGRLRQTDGRRQRAFELQHQRSAAMATALALEQRPVDETSSQFELRGARSNLRRLERSSRLRNVNSLQLPSAGISDQSLNCEDSPKINTGNLRCLGLHLKLIMNTILMRRVGLFILY